MLNKSENELSGVFSTAMACLGLYRDPIVAQNTSSSDFRIADLMQAGSPVPSLGRLSFFETELAYLAGYGIKCFMIAQSLNQIEKAYGPNNSILDNSHVRITYGALDEPTARRRERLEDRSRWREPPSWACRPFGDDRSGGRRCRSPITRRLRRPARPGWGALIGRLRSRRPQPGSTRRRTSCNSKHLSTVNVWNWRTTTWISRIGSTRTTTPRESSFGRPRACSPLLRLRLRGAHHALSQLPPAVTRCGTRTTSPGT